MQFCNFFVTKTIITIHSIKVGMLIGVPIFSFHFERISFHLGLVGIRLCRKNRCNEGKTIGSFQIRERSRHYDKHIDRVCDDADHDDDLEKEYGNKECGIAARISVSGQNMLAGVPADVLSGKDRDVRQDIFRYGR